MNANFINGFIKIAGDVLQFPKDPERLNRLKGSSSPAAHSSGGGVVLKFDQSKRRKKAPTQVVSTGKPTPGKYGFGRRAKMLTALALTGVGLDYPYSKSKKKDK